MPGCMSAQWLLPLIMIRTERDRAHTDTGPKWAKYNEPIVIGTAIVVHQASEATTVPSLTVC